MFSFFRFFSSVLLRYVVKLAHNGSLDEVQKKSEDSFAFPLSLYKINPTSVLAYSVNLIQREFL